MNYSAYNLTIQSDIILPLPKAAPDAQPDITITIGPVQEPENLSRTYDGVWYAHGKDSLYLRWDTIGSYLIEDGESITFSGISPPSESSPVVPLLGTVMAVAMHQRKMTVLHGSSVLIDNAALVFLGEKGEGKSTIAAFLQKQGHALLSDDVCAIDMQNQGPPLLMPSFSKFKLWPDSMHYLNINPEKYERIHQGFEKRDIPLDTGFAYAPAPVGAIVVLSTGPELTLEPLVGHQAIPNVIPHLIINRFSKCQPGELAGAMYFQLVELMKRLPLYHLTRQRDLSMLPKAAEIVGGIRKNHLKN